MLNRMDVPPGQHLDRWYNFLWGLGVDEQWLIFWKATLSPDDFRDVALAWIPMEWLGPNITSGLSAVVGSRRIDPGDCVWR